MPHSKPFTKILLSLTLVMSAKATPGPNPGLGEQDWRGILAARDQAQYAFRHSQGGFEATNPGQQWRTRFDTEGFMVRSESPWKWGLALQSYGFESCEKHHERPVVFSAEGQRLRCAWDSILEEWLINDERGLEHGFTLKCRPASLSSSSELRFSLKVLGGLRPTLGGADALRFLDSEGVCSLTYGGLKVWDATGRTLPARFSVDENQVQILVDERGAQYPVTIDPIAQQAYLKASNTGSGDTFGKSVAISGDTVVVGAPGEDSGTSGVNSTPDETTLANSGAAYVFLRNGATWTQQAYLKASNPGADDAFGISVAISGDTIIVGAWQEDSSTTGVNSTPNEGAPNAGAAYVFKRNGTTWSQQAYLKANNPGIPDIFGCSVAISGDLVAVGAPFESSNSSGVNKLQNDLASESGAVYIFTRASSVWAQRDFIKASNTGRKDNFGYSVALSGDTLVVGSWREGSSTTGINSTPNELASGAGAAYILRRAAIGWTYEAFLKSTNTRAFDQYGQSVGVSGDTVIVGSPADGSDTTGVNSTPHMTANNYGAAFVYTRSGTSWSQQAYLKAPVITNADAFGTSVAISGDIAVVGSWGEDTNKAGVDQAMDDLLFNSGAAYVFSREGQTWTQKSFLKASNPGSNQEFGAAVAVSGGTVLVGSYRETSSTTGINSTPNFNGFGFDAGAAYVFAGFAPALTPVQTWRQAMFGSIGDTGDGANLADPDGDGHNNLVEYGLVTNPAASDGAMVPSLAQASDKNYLRGLFIRDPSRVDVNIRVETTDNLAGPWITVASSIKGAVTTGIGFVSETDLADGLKEVIARDTIPTTDSARRLLRIVVEEAL